MTSNTDGSVTIFETDEARITIGVDDGLVCDPDESSRPGTVWVEVDRYDPVAGWGTTDQFAAPTWDGERIGAMMSAAVEAAR